MSSYAKGSKAFGFCDRTMQATHRRYAFRDLIAVLMKVVRFLRSILSGEATRRLEAVLLALTWRVLLGA